MAAPKSRASRGLELHAATRTWFTTTFPTGPTEVQSKGWPAIHQNKSVLLLAPTGSGKTLAAFLAAIDRLMFEAVPEKQARTRVLYVSPLKALAVDVERNLRAPIAGVSAAAHNAGIAHHVPEILVRSGDTPQKERARSLKHPPDIVITTPESLFLLLTSSARENLRHVETVIVDEIHSLVGSKRGAHLFLSLERLEALRSPEAPELQRIGLSATMRPLDEVARLLGGASEVDELRPKYRPIEIIDASKKKQIELVVEVPIEDMSQLGKPDEDEIPSGPAAQNAPRRSIWPSIHPRLVELIREHRSTIIFANSRRLAERLAAAINELAAAEIALAHHGSIAREKRQVIEDRLKAGHLPAIVATSSLELGIDMGAVDLVIQIEAPPSVASGLQRIGRASHQVGGIPRGIIFPKYRGDLLATAAATEKMMAGDVESIKYPRNPLDVLAQQIVAIASMDPIAADELYALARRAAPFTDLPRSSFEGVLDMLSGRYPSDDFAELRPRITWDRVRGMIEGRGGAKRTAIANAGTIPDRGLYGVFLAGEDEKRSRRVGELDEEMVFESRTGEVFLLGASSWRIEEITHDRVLVTPAPGEPGKMPFWHGDRPGRPIELGRAIGGLAKKIHALGPDRARALLQERHGLDERAADNLIAYLGEQAEATGEVPSDKTIVVERTTDDVGDWRICILSPLGARVLAPWAIAVRTRLESEASGDVDVMWSDDGIVFRIQATGDPPPLETFFPRAEEIEAIVSDALGGTSLFASRFRECAARALLLPRRFPGRRSPLWAQRKRSRDLLDVASKYGSFPILLETYRECLRDVFDLPALSGVLEQIASRDLRVVEVESRTPSPFASSLLFSYIGNFIYEGDAPLAERRAQALSVDQAQLRELLGESELRELLSAEAIEEVERSLQRLDRPEPLPGKDALHDLLLAIGDLSFGEMIDRSGGTPKDQLEGWIAELVRERRIIPLMIGGEPRYAASEDAARYRDAVGAVPPVGLPSQLLEPVADPLGDLISRYARTHGPFAVERPALRFGLAPRVVRSALERLASRDRVLEGELLPRGKTREWCDAEVLRRIKRLSLARLRKEVEPVEAPALARFLTEWHQIARPAFGMEGLLAALEQLQGLPIPASVLEREVLPARVKTFKRSDLDELVAAGELIWRGLEPIGTDDGRIALYLSDQYELLAPPVQEAEGELPAKIREVLEARGAVFFSELAKKTGAFPHDLMSALWSMVWAGEVTNDTLAPLRVLWRKPEKDAKGRRAAAAASGRRARLQRAAMMGPPGSSGRWSLLPRARAGDTARAAALAAMLLERYGVVTREAVQAENIAGGFSTVYPVLKAMEEAGKIRRGYFVAGLGATQFALPGADDRLRKVREGDGKTHLLAASDPANPYGAALAWPPRDGARPQRSAGAQVVLHDGRLAAWIGRTEKNLLTFLPEEEPEKSETARAIAAALASLVGEGGRRALLIEKIDGLEPSRSPLAGYLREAGFSAISRGFFKKRGLSEGAHAGR